MCRRERSDLYAMHLKKLAKARHVVQNEAPVLPIEKVTCSGKAMQDNRRFREITEQNRRLLCRIDRIYRTGGAVDSFNFSAGCRVSRLPKRIDELRLIDFQNTQMLLRILKAVRLFGTFESSNVEKPFQKPQIRAQKDLESWEKAVEDIRLKARYDLNLPDLQPRVIRFRELPLFGSEFDGGHPRVFLKFSVNQRPVGRVVFALNIELPSSLSFFDFFEAQQETSPLVQRIFPGLFMRFENPELTFNGTLIAHDMGYLSHDRFGTLSVIPASDEKFHFAITLRSQLHSLDATATVIGHAVSGLEVLKHVGSVGHRASGRPVEPVTISGWGIIHELARPAAMHTKMPRGRC